MEGFRRASRDEVALTMSWKALQANSLFAQGFGLCVALVAERSWPPMALLARAECLKFEALSASARFPMILAVLIACQSAADTNTC